MKKRKQNKRYLEFLKAGGLKDSDIADFLGISRGMANRIKNGSRLPAYDKMVLIEDASDGYVELESWRAKPKRKRKPLVRRATIEAAQ